MNFNQQLQERTTATNEIIARHLPYIEGYQSKIVETMEYSLLGGGKRIRPILMQESYKLFGGDSPLIEFFMTAIEMIHQYSLVHDDLPAMDNDEYRHGKKSSHIMFGEDMAILTGDALLNLAYETAIDSYTHFPHDADRIMKALLILSKKAGVYGMIGGQVIDVQNENQAAIDINQLLSIYGLKTSALMEASMMIGALLAGAEAKEIAVMEEVAADVGLAFQIQDDILDVTSDLNTLGKATHSDEKLKKSTYVSLKGIEAAKEKVQSLSDGAIAKLKSLPVENQFLEDLLTYLISRQN